MKRFKFGWTAGTILLAASILIGGCGNGGADKGATASDLANEAQTANAAQANGGTEAADAGAAANAGGETAAATDGATKQATDAVGHELTVPVKPQRIIAPFLEDGLAALGVKPAAQWSAGGVPQHYLQDKLKDVPTLDMMGGLKPEDTLQYNPDLIIFMAPPYIKEGLYDSFAKIAPSFVLAKDESDWRANFKALGDLLGKSDKAEQVLADYDRKAAEAKEKIAGSVGSGKTAVIFQSGGEKGYKLFGENFYSGALLYGGLGFAVPAAVKGDYETYSLESLSALKDVDYIFVISGEGREKPPVDNPLWKQLKAVKDGHVFDADSGHWFNANVIANGLIIDDVLNDVAKS